MMKLVKPTTGDALSNLLINTIELEFIQLLIKHTVRFLLVGGYAMRRYDHVRVTSDLDLWVDTAGDNPSRLLNALGESPYLSVSELTVEELSQPFKEIRLNGMLGLIELLTSFCDLDFTESYNSREIAENDIPVISATDLLTAKYYSQPLRTSEAGRLKDRGDIDALELYLKKQNPAFQGRGNFT